MILMIDNYDSFTYNIVQYINELNFEVKVCRNDEITCEDILTINPLKIVLSPGPCSPSQAGICLELIEQFKGKIPIFGVCLGCQAIGQAMGGKIIQAKQIMHGKVSPICHNNKGVFKDLPQAFNATRYHSLVIEQETIPDFLELTAWTEDVNGNIDEIMGVKHKTFDLEGVQFHPESILSEFGKEILLAFLSRN